MARTAYWWSKKKGEAEIAEEMAEMEDIPQELVETPPRRYNQGKDGHLMKATLNELASKT